MSTEAFLDLVRQRFSPAEGKIILESLTQDPLVWQFVQNEKKSFPYFDSAANELQAFMPGSIAKWLIEQDMDVSLPELGDLTHRLPDPVRQRSAKNFQTAINTGLPPIDLIHAGLLALTLRERRLIKESWLGISEEIFKNQNPSMILKNIQTWRTPFACLFGFCSDFDQLTSELLTSKNPSTIKAAIPILLHADLANPGSFNDHLEELFSISKGLSIEGQLEFLQWLDGYERNNLQNSLASNLMQIRENQKFFADLFSELELLESLSSHYDPLEKPIRFSLPERLNQLAAFHYHSGNQEKAVETYQNAFDLINTIQSQTRFQTLVIQNTKATPSAWIKMIQNLPNSQKAHLFHIRSLIENRKFDEAREKLINIPDSSEKTFLEMMLNPQNELDSSRDKKQQQNYEITPLEKSLPVTEFFVRKPEIYSSKEIINAIENITDSKQRLSFISRFMQRKSRDKEFLSSARNEFEKAGFFNRAIEIASYLERLEPEKVEHQRALARLYCKSKRWQDAFSLLQKMIRDVSEPEISDLAAFAESALMTGRTDMAISICQNILKQDNTHAKAMILLGKGYVEKGDIVKAIQHMEQVVSLIPDDPQTWIQLARFWENSGQTDRAFEVLRQGILAIPDDPNLLHEIGRAHLEKASPTEARVYLRKAFDGASSNPEIRLNLARAEHKLGEYEKAYDLIAPLSDTYDDDFAIAHLLGNILLKMGETERAEPVLLSAARQDPSDLRTVLKVADLVLGNNKTVADQDDNGPFVNLESILDKALIEHPKNDLLKLRIADLDRLMGRSKKAHENYTKLAMSDQGQKDLPGWRIQYGLGLTSVALGDIEIGLAALQDAAHTQPGNLEILHALAQTYVKADLREMALESAKSAIKAKPQDIDNLIWYAQFNADQNQITDALQALKEALQLAPDRLEISYLLAKNLISKGELDEANEYLNKLIANEKTNANLLQNTAYLCIQAQKLNQAASALEKALNKSDRTHPTLLMDLAVLYTLMDQRKKALEILDISKATFQKFPHLAMFKSDLLSEIGQYHSAVKILELFKEAIEQSIDEHDTIHQEVNQSPLLFQYDFSQKGYLLRYGQLLRATGKLDQARTLLEKAQKIFSKDQQIQNALVGTLIASMDNDGALRIIERNNPLGAASSDLGLNQLDLICSQIEILLERNEKEKVKTILDQPALKNRVYPRIFALRSRLAAREGDIAQSNVYLERAIEDHLENLRNNNPSSPTELFRITANLLSLTKAFQEVEDYQSAHIYQQEAWKRIKNQPNINLQFAQLIIDSAEQQQIAQAIMLTEHAPGKQFLDDKYYQLGIGLIDGLGDFLPVKDLVCLHARLSSAFTEKWPSHLNTDQCLDSPEVASAYIVGCKEPDRVSDIVSAFSGSIQVLQASAIFTLKTGLGKGKTDIENALQLDTTNPINHALLGMLMIDEPKLAVKSFETALQLWPGESEWHRILADLYTGLGDTEKATEHITQAIEKQPDNGSYWQTRAGINVKLNQLEQAKTDLEKSTQLKSQDAAGWISMADVNRRLGNISEAINNMNTAVTLRPDDSDIAIREIEFLLDQQQYQKAAEKAAERIGNNSDNSQLRILLARSRAKLGKFDQALQTLVDFGEQIQMDPGVKLETIKIKKDRDGIASSLPALIKLAEQYPEDPEILTTLTDWLIQANRLEEAKVTAQTILRIIPDSAKVHLMLGRLQRLEGQLDQAIAHLSDAIAHDPDLIEAYIELGKTYQDRRDLEEAINIFQMGSKADASDPRPYYHAAMALKTCKDYSGAEAMLKQAKKFAPGDTNIVRQLGVITALNLINNLRETR